MKLFARLQKSYDCWFFLCTSFFFFLLRLPSLFEPYWYGDEGIYQVLGMGIRSGRLLYRDIWDNKPPLLYSLYAIFGSDQFTIRFVSLAVGLLSVIVFFYLARRLFAEKKVAYLTTGIFAFLFGTPFLEGNIANSENFMMLPILGAGLLTFIWAHSQKEKTLFYIGLLLSIAFLFKAVAVFDFIAFTIFLFFVLHTRNNRVLAAVKMLRPLLASFFLPIGIIALFFFSVGAFWDFFDAAFKQNVGYVGYGNSLIIAQGFLYFKVIVLGGFLYVLFRKRHLFSPAQLFIIIWFIFSLFNAFFSQRPYTHYLLVLLPSFVFFGAMVITAKTSSLARGGKILLVIILFLLIKNFWLYTKIIPYYQNYIDFISNRKTVFAYQKFFDAKTPWDYELAAYLRAHLEETDNVFIWGNNAQVYRLINRLPLGRYTVAYHMRANEKTIRESIDAIEKAKPKFIVVMAGEPMMPYVFSNYLQKFVIERAIIYERIGT